MTHTESELVLAGYGLRPDPLKAPKGYASWLQAAQLPATRVAGPGVTLHHRSHGTSPTWGGCVATRRNQKYAVVSSNWSVPAVTGQLENCADEVNNSALWVGLNGLGTGDIVQTGTESDVFDDYYCQFYDGGLSFTYDAWIQYFPFSPQWVFNVNPGDTMFGEAWVVNSDGALNANGSYGWFFINDETTSAAWLGSIGQPQIFTGASAEWIMEESSMNAGGPGQDWLANFGESSLTNMQTWDTVNGWQSIDSQPVYNWFMYRGSQLLVYPYCGSNNGWYANSMLINFNHY
jgi:hypothetical protein